MTIVREFTQERDGISARVVVSTVSDGFRAVVVAYRDDRDVKATLEAQNASERVSVWYPGMSEPLRDYVRGSSVIQENLTHNVPVTTEYLMSLVAMRFLGIAA